MIPYLVESALLTHGLLSVSDETLQKNWPAEGGTIVWVDNGQIITGGIGDYLPFRRRADSLVRIDWQSLDKALSDGISGALTASGTMAVCLKKHIPLAVSCGIGGIGDIRGEELCPDLPALETIPVTLLATAFKDMLDIRASIEWLQERGVPVRGIGCSSVSGYIFKGESVALDGPFEGVIKTSERGLILNPIPEEDRIADSELLNRGIAAGKQAENEGRYYHPAANAAFDRLTCGRSSFIQMKALIRNIDCAERMTR